MSKTDTPRPYKQVLDRLRGAGLRPTRQRLALAKMLLEGPDRSLWQKPDEIMDALNIADGSRVADVGAGAGWFTVRLARRVGPNGRVYAEDIQQPMLDAIDYRVRREGLTNVDTVPGTPEDPTLPAGLDAVLIVDVYAEVPDPVSLPLAR